MTQQYSIAAPNVLTSTGAAFASLMCMCVGTVLSVAMVPDDIEPLGAMFMPAVILTAALVVPTAIMCLQYPLRALLPEHLIVAGIVYWVLLDLLQSAYPLQGVDRSGVVRALVAVGIYGMGFRLAGLHRQFRLPATLVHSARAKIPPVVMFSVLLASFLLGIFRYAYPCQFNPVTMAVGLTSDRFSAPWSRGAAGDWQSFLDHLAYFGYLLPALTVCVARQMGRLSLEAVVGYLLTIISLAFLMHSGARRNVGVSLGAALMCWLLLQPRLGRREFVTSVLAMAGILAILQFMLLVRGVGLAEYGKTETSSYTHLHVDDNFLRLAQITELVPDAFPHTYEKQILYTLCRPIPRVLWSGKPMDPGFNLAKTLGAKGVSLTCSVIGEWYLCGGWLMILFGGWLHGVMAMTWGQLLRLEGSVSRALMYGIGFMALIAGLRAMPEFVLISYVLLAWLLLSRLFLGRATVEDRTFAKALRPG